MLTASVNAGRQKVDLLCSEWHDLDSARTQPTMLGFPWIQCWQLNTFVEAD